jgi:hypothetical protein
MVAPTRIASPGMKDRRPPSALAVYFGRMRGAGTRTTIPQPISVVLLSWGAAAIGIFLIAIPSLYVDLPVSTRLFLIGSFGASAALLYGAPHSDFAQPRNLVVGQLLAALVGVTAYKVLGAACRPRRGAGCRDDDRDTAARSFPAPPGRGDCAHRGARSRTGAPARLPLRPHARPDGLCDPPHRRRDHEQPFRARQPALSDLLVVMSVGPARHPPGGSS